MSSPLEGPLAKTITKAVNPFMSDLTYHELISVDDGEGGDDPSTVDHSTRGFLDEYDDFYRLAGQVPLGDMRILILQNKLTPTPKLKDRITVPSRPQTFEIVNIDQDPATATWDFQARPWDT